MNDSKVKHKKWVLKWLKAVLEVCKTLPNESLATRAEPAAAEEAAYAVISLVKFGHITFDSHGQITSPQSETGKRHRAGVPARSEGTKTSFQMFRNLEAGNPRFKLRQLQMRLLQKYTAPKG